MAGHQALVYLCFLGVYTKWNNLIRRGWEAGPFHYL